MTATTYQTMRVETDDRLAVMTVDRPEARNALSRQVLTELRDALAALRDDDRVGAVALTGAGERAFVAGADIDQLKDDTLHTGLAGEMQQLFHEIQRLARLVGTGRAIDVILTGRFLDATDAERFGLVTAVVPLAGLLDEARAVAARILAKGPLAVQLAKLVVRTGMDADQRTGLALERLARSLIYTTADKREGAEAFLGKRAPQFEGR